MRGLQFVSITKFLSIDNLKSLQYLMPTTAQMLATYPDILLQVIAELRGAFLDAADSREDAIDLLAAQLTEPTSVQIAYQEVTDMSDQAQNAVETLLKENGEMVEAQFSRDFGRIRQMGPAKLERETPWLYPQNVSELLYYYGFLGRGIKGTGSQAHTIVYLTSDTTPWLPHPQSGAAEGGLPIQPVPPPPDTRTLPADDSFLEDVGTFLGFLRTDSLRLNGDGPNPEDIDRLVQRFQLPFTSDIPELNTRLALLLHLANRMRWLRRGEEESIQLTVNSVTAFLEKSRAEQRKALWDAWCESPEWNDLCRVPELECTNTGNWQNDPLQTRRAVLALVGKLQAGLWYSLDDFVNAVKEVEPDFQRPTGNYDTWYIRNTHTQEFLKGFNHWDDVEGTLLRFLIGGPLHWLGAIDLAEPSAGDDLQFSLSQWGARWLGQDVPQPNEQVRRPMVVGDDFTITLAPGTPLAERFRVERFSQWQGSYPQFVYQINQRSLIRAAETKISPTQIAEFLKRRSRSVPDKVLTALDRFANAQSVSSPQ